MRDVSAWRRPGRGIVVETAAQVLDYVGGVLAVPQTVLTAAYWAEIRTGPPAGVARAIADAVRANTPRPTAV